MCLAIPQKIEKVNRRAKRATIEGGTVVDITMVPRARRGQFLLVHAGLAIQALSEKEARETLDIVEQGRCGCGEHSHSHSH